MVSQLPLLLLLETFSWRTFLLLKCSNLIPICLISVEKLADKPVEEEDCEEGTVEDNGGGDDTETQKLLIKSFQSVQNNE